MPAPEEPARNRALALYDHGRHLMARGRPHEALARFEESFTLSPCHKAAFGAANCLAVLERHEEAVRWLLSAHSLKPQPWLLIEAAERSLDMGRPQAAEQYLQQAIALRPDHAMALDMLRRLRGEPDPPPDPAAIARDERALAIHHEGWGLMRQEKWSEALARFEDSYAIQPTVGAACQASKCLFQLGRPDEALDRLLKAIALNPRQADVAVTIAREYHRRGQPEEALRYADQALAANLHHGPALRMKKALHENGDRPT